MNVKKKKNQRKKTIKRKKKKRAQTQPNSPWRGWGWGSAWACREQRWVWKRHLGRGTKMRRSESCDVECEAKEMIKQKEENIAIACNRQTHTVHLLSLSLFLALPLSFFFLISSPRRVGEIREASLRRNETRVSRKLPATPNR